MEIGGSTARNLVLVGGAAFCLGTLDPLEGSLLILAGCGLIALGTHLGSHRRAVVLYWLWTFGLMVFGVGALWGLSAVGGVGGEDGRSYWWLLVCLPYPVAWLMALGGIIVRLSRAFKWHAPKAPPDHPA